MSIRLLFAAFLFAVTAYFTAIAAYVAIRINPLTVQSESVGDLLATELGLLAIRVERLDSLVRLARAARGSPEQASSFTLEMERHLADGAVNRPPPDASIPAELREILLQAREEDAALVATLRGLAETARGGVPLEEIMAKLRRGMGRVNALMLDAQAESFDLIADLHRDMEITTDAVARTVAGWLVLGAVMMPFGFWLLYRRVVTPMRTLDAGLARVVEGDLDVTLEVRREDEVGRLVNQFNQMTSILRSRAERSSANLERVEQELQRTEQYFRSFVEHASDIITVLDAEGTIKFVSPSVTHVLGYSPIEMVGLSTFDFVHPDDVSLIKEAFRAGMDPPGSEEEVAVRYRHKDGSWRMIEATGRNLLHDPAVEGIVVASRDITERVEREELLRQAQKMEIVGQLTGGVAHDFNNMLTVMIGSLELLKDDTEPDSKADDLIDQATQAANRAASLTRELLAFSRRQALRPKVLSLDRVVSGTLEMLRRTLGERITVEMRSPDDLWSCKVDPVQFETALLNLAVNARHAMPEGGELIIELGHTVVSDGGGDSPLELDAGDYVRVTVSDTGTGMTPETVERAFEPFFTTKEVGRGSGLGLSMVYGFVKQSGGDVRIESTQDEGTRVTAYIPRA